ncbi:Transcription repressor OFP13 [Linum perenne]
MEEMVEFQGIGCKDWDQLEELLQWYLNVKDKKNHSFIVVAFLDFLLRISGADGGCGGGPTTVVHGRDSSASTMSFSSAVTCLPPSHSSSTTNSDFASLLFYRRWSADQVKFC